LFVLNTQVIGCVGRLRNDLYCVGWGVKLYSTNQPLPTFSVTGLLVRCYSLYSTSHVGLPIRLCIYCRTYQHQRR